MTPDDLIDAVNRITREAADEIEGLNADLARRRARDAIASLVRWVGEQTGRDFKASAKVFTKTALPDLAASAEFEGFHRLLTFAGFGGDMSLKITVQMLRDWSRDARLPPVETIDMRKEWHTAEEYTSLSRAGILPGLPTTLRGMQKYLDKAAAGTDLRRKRAG